MKTFSASYRHKGTEWCLNIMAEDTADALARLRALGMNGTVDGELMMEVPAVIGWWVPFVCWLRNLFA